MQYEDIVLDKFKHEKNKKCKYCGEIPVLRIYYYETGQKIIKVVCPHDCFEKKHLDLDEEKIDELIDEWNKKN